MTSAESRRVVVTGTSRGLGRAMAERFTALGHRVAGCSRAELDVSDWAAVAAWAARLVEREGPPDLLVANAAVALPSLRTWEVDPADFSRTVDVNLKGVFHLMRAFLPSMLERGSGVLVSMTSDWGRHVSPLVSTYCATKWALEGFTRALARELPLGLAAVLVDPGNVDTDMLRLALGPELAARYPGAERWAEHAVPQLLRLGPAHNGRLLRMGCGHPPEVA